MWYVFHSSIQFGAKALIASAEAGNVDCMRLLLAAANADLELVDADVRVFDLNAYLHNEVSVSFEIESFSFFLLTTTALLSCCVHCFLLG
jgi:hypothetical protein